VSAPAGTNVTVFLDGLRIAEVETDEQGRFVHTYPVEKIETGTHAAYASVGVAISEEAGFSVVRRNTTTGLAAARLVEVGRSLADNWTVVCSGTLLTEDGVPVKNTSVDVYVDERYSGSGQTGEDGTYAFSTSSLDEGTRNLTVAFYPDGLPLNWSESAPVGVVVPGPLDTSAFLYLAGLGGGAVGAMLLLRRRRPAAAAAVASVIPPPEPVVVLPPAPTPLEAAAAAALLVEGVDGREAVTRLYRRLVRELDARHPGQYLFSFTPRELAARFAADPVGGELAVLVRVHERVRYAGERPMEEDIRLVHTAFIKVISEGGVH
jgi:hypothetical protein